MSKRPKAPPAPAATPEALQPLVAAVRTLRANDVESIAEASVLCSAIEIQDATLADVCKQLKMPFSTASRVAWALSQRGLLTYENHPTDRRKKLLRPNLEALSG